MARAGAARNVKAVVVVRPPLAQDSAQRECLHASPLGDGSYAVSLDALAGKEANFTFPAAYGHGAQPPEALCPTEIEPLLQGCFAGESACVLAYGHTGAGKSYTMGTEAHGARWEGSVGAFVSRRIFEMAAERGLAAVVVECGMVEVRTMWYRHFIECYSVLVQSGGGQDFVATQKSIASICQLDGHVRQAGFSPMQLNSRGTIA